MPAKQAKLVLRNRHERVVKSKIVRVEIELSLTKRKHEDSSQDSSEAIGKLAVIYRQLASLTETVTFQTGKLNIADYDAL